MTYYTVVMALTWMALVVLCELVRENNRMSADSRRLCYAEFALIAASAFAEWCSVTLGNIPGIPSWTILLAKWADYVLTPIAGGTIAWQLRMHNRWERVLNIVLVVNAAFQTIAFPAGQMVVLNEHNQYAHAGMHVVYVAIYLAVFAIIVVQFALFGRSFSKQNRGSLYLIVALAMAGVALQELLGGEVRVAYLSLTLGAAFLYIRNGEFSQLTQDENLEAQRELLMVDDLTGIGSRRAYSETLELHAMQGMPANLTAFCADINGLKETNDSLGHAAGDELIRAAADCIQRVFLPDGSCFRTGGDEFVVLVTMDEGQAKEALNALEQEAAAWKGSAGQELHIACGYARTADWPNTTPEGLVMQADQAMYNSKKNYYQKAGRHQRRALDEPATNA